MSALKICAKCIREKLPGAFNKSNAYKDGLAKICRDCNIERDRKARKPDYWRETWMQRKYGLSIKQYDLMFESQKGLCAICSQSETMKRLGKLTRLSVDHCHASGKIRGLLCNNCNIILGYLQDKPDLFNNITSYLEKYR